MTKLNDDYYFIATIVGTHALKGEVRVYSVTDFKEERYKIGNTLYIERNNELIDVKVKSHREHKGNDLLTFEGYTNINQVEQFVKCKLYVHKSQLQELDDNEFYYFELIGCTVFTPDNQEIGIVKDIVNYGASDIIIIEDANKKQIMVPFVDEFVGDVDLEVRTIQINPIEGLLGE